jgi:uncharacterized membrane protein YphA (DoxX/SURF4 family)
LLTLGGASILLGFRPKLGSLAILGFLATASPAIHDFWNDHDAGQKQNNMIHFSKNMALLGAALALLGVEEPWPVSVHGKDEETREDLEVTAEEKPLRLSQRRAERRRAA